MRKKIADTTNSNNKPMRRKRRRKSVYSLSNIDEKKQVSTLPEFFAMMQYESDSPAAYCSVIARSRREEAPGLKTMAVTVSPDGSYRLLYDPLFNEMVRSRDNWDTVRMILIHELIHLEGQHPARSLTMYVSCNTDAAKAQFRRINPFAIDFACNSIGTKYDLFSDEQLLSGKPLVLNEDGSVLTDSEGRPVGKWRGVLPSEEPWCLPRNLSYEKYYNILKKIDEGEIPKEWTKGKGSGEDSDLSQRLADCKDRLDSSGGEKMFIHLEDIDIDSLSEEEIESIVQESERVSQEIKSDLVDALKSRGLGAGRLCKDLESSIAPPQIPWQQVLKAFVRKASMQAKPKKSIRRQNKRREDNGVWSPFPGKQKDKKVRLLVAFDTSGSVSDAEFEEMRNEILALHGLLSEITVVYCDTRIANIEKLTASSELPKKIWGRGGTSFDPPFQWAKGDISWVSDTGEVKKYKGVPDIIVYGTDGECTLPPPHVRLPGVPLLWIVSSRGCLPGHYYGGPSMVPGTVYDCDYGKAVKLNSLK